MAAYNGTIQFRRNKPNASDLRVNFGDQQFTIPSNLLVLSLYQCPFDLIPEDDAAPMQLDTGSLVCFKIVYSNELLSIVKELIEFRERHIHSYWRRSACLISDINSAMRCSFFRMS